MSDWQAIEFQFKNYEIGSKQFKLVFTDKHVQLNDVVLAYCDVEAMRFAIYPPIRGRGWKFSLEYLAPSKKKMTIEFHCGRFSREKLEERIALWSDIIRVNTERVLNPMVLAALEKIRSGGVYKVGKVECNKESIQLRTRRWLLFSKPVLVLWPNVLKRDHDDWLYLSSSVDPSVAVSMSAATWNVVVLRRLLDYLWQDGRLAELTAE